MGTTTPHRWRPVTHTPVHVRYEAATHAVSIAGDAHEDQIADFILGGLERLIEFLVSAEVVAAGAPGTLYAPELADEIEHLEAVVPIAAPLGIPPAERQVRLTEVPAAWVAVLVHAGDYASMGETYRTLGAWVARHAEPSGERIREWYTVSPLNTSTTDEFRTEIAWPITAPPGASRGGRRPEA